MKISTFNIQNNYKNYDKIKAKQIYNYMKKNKIDIFGLQEVFNKCSEDLNSYLDNNYQMIGEYRFLSKLLLRRFNEKTPIITNYKITSYKTYRLPHFPSVLKRILTHIVIEYKGKEISIYNTHLEVRNLSVKRRQLKKIYNIIKNDHRKIILMGDFNLKNNNPIFLDFVDSLKKIGIMRVSLNEKTLKQSRYSREIDHIFISECFNLIKKQVVKNLDISDHYPVIVEIEI